LQALEEENLKTGLKQTDIARTIGVHRSVINRELRGKKDITLGRVAELASAMGRLAILELPEISQNNVAVATSTNCTSFDFRQLLNVTSTTAFAAPSAAANSNIEPIARAVAL
jgi:transcriptional regulator with XRE-family HTH domain